MIHLIGLMSGRDSVKVFDKEDNSGFIMKDGVTERNLNALDENNSAISGVSDDLLKLDAAGYLRPRVALAPKMQVNNRTSRTALSLKRIAVHFHETKRLWNTDQFIKKDHTEEKVEQSLSPYLSPVGESPDPVPLTDVLYMKIKTHFSSPHTPSLNTITKSTPQTAYDQFVSSDIGLDQNQNHHPLSRQNLALIASLSNPEFSEPFFQSSSQTLRRDLPRQRCISSIKLLPAVRECTDNICQDRFSDDPPLRNVRCQPKSPILNVKDHVHELVIKKARQPLNSRTGQLARPSKDPDPVKRRYLQLPRELLDPVIPKFETISLAPSPILRPVSSHHLAGAGNWPNNQRFLGRQRTPSTPEFLHHSEKLLPSQFQTRSRSLTSLRHEKTDRKIPLFIGTHHSTLLIPVKRCSIIHVTRQHRRPSGKSKRVPVLSPVFIFALETTKMSSKSDDLGSPSANSTRPLTNGVAPSRLPVLRRGLGGNATRVNSYRRHGSNAATHGSLSGAPSGSQAPPNSPPHGVVPQDTESVLTGASQGLSYQRFGDNTPDHQDHVAEDSSSSHSQVDHSFDLRFGVGHGSNHGLYEFDNGSDELGDFYNHGAQDYDNLFGAEHGYEDFDAQDDHYPHDMYDDYDGRRAQYNQGYYDPYYGADLFEAYQAYAYDYDVPAGQIEDEEDNHDYAPDQPSTPIRVRSPGASLEGPATPYRSRHSHNDRSQESFEQAIDEGASLRATLSGTPTHRPARRALAPHLGAVLIDREGAEGIERDGYEPRSLSDIVNPEQLMIEPDVVEGPTRLERMAAILMRLFCVRPAQLHDFDD